MSPNDQALTRDGWGKRPASAGRPAAIAISLLLLVPRPDAQRSGAPRATASAPSGVRERRINWPSPSATAGSAKLCGVARPFSSTLTSASPVTVYGRPGGQDRDKFTNAPNGWRPVPPIYESTRNRWIDTKTTAHHDRSDNFQTQRRPTPKKYNRIGRAMSHNDQGLPQLRRPQYVSRRS